MADRVPVWPLRSITILSVFWLVCLAGCGGKKTEQVVIDPKDLAPDFEIGHEKERPVRLGDLRGKVGVLAFTSDYFDAGRQLHDCLATIHLLDTGHQVFFVEIVRDSSAGNGTVPVVVDSLFARIADPKDVYRRYRIKKIPTVVLIDRLGKEVYRHEGYNAEITCSSVLRPKIAELTGK